MTLHDYSELFTRLAAQIHRLTRRQAPAKARLIKAGPGKYRAATVYVVREHVVREHTRARHLAVRPRFNAYVKD